ncbi:hypothetical protein MSPP1_000956 [Malassezia sp. CBS 17886]|nr:hypothetical protein MSPP1_000956 [Malassezia sp. CBS 17886]
MEDGGTVGASHAYTFPELHSFAPFYTLQPNPQTAATQIDAWSQLIVAYCAAHGRFLLDAAGAWERTSDLFCDRDLDRALSPTTLQVIFARMVQQGRAVYEPPLPRSVKPPHAGSVPVDHRTQALSVQAAAAGAVPTGVPGSVVLVLWRTPDEWGTLLYNWICDTGQNQSVLTWYELTQGDFVTRNALPPQLLRLALQALVRKGRAQVFTATSAGRFAASRTDVLSDSLEASGVKFV